jgi:hypothetical protein
MMSERRHLIGIAPPPTDDEHRVVRRRSAKTDGKARWRESIHRGDPNIATILGLAEERVFIVGLMAAGISPAANIHGFSLHPRLSGPP